MNSSSLLSRRIDGVMFSPAGRLVGLLLDDGSGIAFDRAEILEVEEVRQEFAHETERNMTATQLRRGKEAECRLARQENMQER